MTAADLERRVPGASGALLGEELRPLLTPDAVASILGISRKQVLRLPLRRVDLGRRSPRYDPLDVAAFIERRKMGRMR